MSEPTIDLGAAVFDRGLFLVRNQQPFRPLEPLIGSASAKFHHTTPGVSATLKRELLKMIKSAKRKIFIASFRFGDPDILKALADAAKRLEGGVYIITALDRISLERGLRELDDQDNVRLRRQRGKDDPQQGWSLDVLNKQFAEMTRQGIYLRGHSNCHAKFAVVDDKVALVCTANFEWRAFVETGECGALLTDSVEAKRMARFFTRLWHQGCNWEVAPGETYVVRERLPVPAPCSVEGPHVSSETPDSQAIWTDGPNEPYILRAIHEVIAAAETDLCLATFGTYGLVDHPALLLDPLKVALEKRPGLRVRLYLRGRNNVPKHRADTDAFHDMGVGIFADSLNHAKGAVADGGRLVALFSANFDPGHGLTSGVEAGVRFNEHPAGFAAATWFNRAIECSDLEYQRRPTAREISTRLAAGWKKDWPLGETVWMTVDREETWTRLYQAAQTAPTLFEVVHRNRNHSDTLQLFAGRESFILEQDQDSKNPVYLSTPRQERQSSTERLEGWLSRRPENGICGIANGSLRHLK